MAVLALFIYLGSIAVSLLVGFVALRAIDRGDQPSGAAGHPDGRTVARRVLKARGIHRRVSVIGGDVDCYMPHTRQVQLADGRLERASTSAAAIAAHEAVHAAQHDRRWLPFRLSSALSLVSVICGPLGFGCLMVAWLADVAVLRTVGSVLLVPVVLASLATLVVEVDASRRALESLREIAPAGVIDVRRARRILVACGATYVTETILDLGFFARRSKNLADDLRGDRDGPGTSGGRDDGPGERPGGGGSGGGDGGGWL